MFGENNFIEVSRLTRLRRRRNVLTRNLIIYGQGLNKSHPFIYRLYDAIINDDLGF